MYLCNLDKLDNYDIHLVMNIFYENVRKDPITENSDYQK